MIKIPKAVYEKFLRFALENANPLDSRSWKECIGLILGKITEQEILVTEIVPIGAGTAVFVDISDYEKVYSLIPFSKIDQGEVIVGWAHTHPGLGLFLSGTDIQTQKLYQQMHPKAFALVMDPTKVTEKFSGFNIYRLDELRSRPTTMEYHFDEQFNFSQTREFLTSELYPILELPIPAGPLSISESEVSWNNINIMINGSTDVRVNQLFQVRISVNLPFRQFIRVEYQAETDNLIEKSFSIKFHPSERFYHETITSGNLGIFNFRSNEIGTSYIRITNLFLSNYEQRLQKMPDLLLKTRIRE